MLPTEESLCSCFAINDPHICALHSLTTWRPTHKWRFGQESRLSRHRRVFPRHGDIIATRRCHRHLCEAGAAPLSGGRFAVQAGGCCQTTQASAGLTAACEWPCWLCYNGCRSLEFAAAAAGAGPGDAPGCFSPVVHWRCSPHGSWVRPSAAGSKSIHLGLHASATRRSPRRFFERRHNAQARGAW